MNLLIDIITKGGGGSVCNSIAVDDVGDELFSIVNLNFGMIQPACVPRACACPHDSLAPPVGGVLPLDIPPG